MAPISILHALSVLPLTLAHMQMLIPSPLRDPHSDRADEPKDYNILTPLHSDGSDFACKGYQHNTPWTTVATYEAGGTYRMTLKGAATHSGGSCQCSISCDGGKEFKVIQSMVGGCPLQKQYDFTIPEELGKLNGKHPAQCLFAWTWFNKIGNREMYMNCAVVEITSPKPHKKGHKTKGSRQVSKRDTAVANAAAQKALSSYPDLFVANLKSINDCVVPETFDVVFDDPGKAISFGEGITASTKSSFKRGACTGKGNKSAGSSSSSSSSSSDGSGSSGNSGKWQDQDSSSGANSGQWQGQDISSQHGLSNQASSTSKISDGMWHADLWGSGRSSALMSNHEEEASTLEQEIPQQESGDSNLEPVYVDSQDGQFDKAVQSDLEAYLATLYGNTRRSAAVRRDFTDANDDVAHALFDPVLPFNGVSSVLDPSFGEQDIGANKEEYQSPLNEDADTDELEDSGDQENAQQGAADDHTDHPNNDVTYHSRRSTRQQRWESYKPLSRRANSKASESQDGSQVAEPGASFKAFLERLNSLNSAVFVLVKYASQYLDHPPPLVGGASSAGDTAVSDGSTSDISTNDASDSVMREDPWISSLPPAESSDSFDKNANPDAQPFTKRAQPVSTADDVKLHEIVETLESLEERVAKLLMYANAGVKAAPEGIRKRQLVVPGIFPASMQDAEAWYFSTFGPYFPLITIDEHGIHVEGHPDGDFVLGGHHDDLSSENKDNSPSIISKQKRQDLLPPLPLVDELASEDGDAATQSFPDVVVDPLYINPVDPQSIDWRKLFPELFEGELEFLEEDDQSDYVEPQEDHGREPSWISTEPESEPPELIPIVEPPIAIQPSNMTVLPVDDGSEEPWIEQGPTSAPWESLNNTNVTRVEVLDGPVLPNLTLPLYVNATTTPEGNLTLGEIIKAMYPDISNSTTEQSLEQPVEPPVDAPIDQSLGISDEQAPSAPQDDWVDGVFPGLVSSEDISRVVSETVARKPFQHHPIAKPEDDDDDVAALLPFFLGPGPVVPEGVTIDWPGPFGPGSTATPASNLESLPKLIDDLGPSAEAEVRKFFSDLKNEAAGSASSESVSAPQTPTATASDTLVTLPALENDLGPAADDEIHRFFDALEKADTLASDTFPTATHSLRPQGIRARAPASTLSSPPPPPNLSSATRTDLPSWASSPTSSPSASTSPAPPLSCADARSLLTTQVSAFKADVAKPCTGLPEGVKIAPEQVKTLEKSLAKACARSRKDIKAAIKKVQGVLAGSCAGIVKYAEENRERFET